MYHLDFKLSFLRGLLWSNFSLALVFVSGLAVVQMLPLRWHESTCLLTQTACTASTGTQEMCIELNVSPKPDLSGLAVILQLTRATVMRHEQEPLLALADKYHDAEEKSDDLTCMESYETAMSMGYTEEQWKDAYNTCWQIRMAIKRKRKQEEDDKEQKWAEALCRVHGGSL